MDLDDLGGGEPLTATVQGKPLAFTYSPDRFTPALVAKLEGERGSDGKIQSASATVIADIIATTVTAWDLKRGGEPIPLSPASVADVPFVVLNPVMEAINGAQTPNPTK